MTGYPIFNKRTIVTAFVIAAVISLGGVRFGYLIQSPDVYFLTDTADAQWIKYDTEFELLSKRPERLMVEFRHRFEIHKPVEGAQFTVQAMKHCSVFLDGKTLFTHPYDSNKWKQVHEITIPFTASPGVHDLVLVITSENSHPAVIAHSETLPIRTGLEWVASVDGNHWTPAAMASAVRLPKVSNEFPEATEGFVKILPYLVLIFTVTTLLSLRGDSASEERPEPGKRLPEPSRFRFYVFAAWLILSVNNMFKISSHIGYDVMQHIKYIDFIVTEAALPLATDGWQMFQAPLYYLISAPLQGLLTPWFLPGTVVQMLRIIPILCGLLQIEIVYRASRLVFPQRKDLQYIAIITGSLLPMHIYICQVVGNEPLAGCLISLVILYCLKLIVVPQEEKQPRFFVLLGLFWGLSLLSKVTAVLLSPVLVLSILAHSRMVKLPHKYVISSVSIVFSVSLLTAGWYYFRNYLEFGSFFVGGWDPSRGFQWWQDPGYRTWSHLLSFGQSLVTPVFSGAIGFWDALYSTLWLDGFNSAESTFQRRPPWNIHFMTAGALLAVIPTLFILSSIWYGVRKQNPSRNAVILSIGTLALFIAVVLDLYIQLPIYSTAKSSYTLGLLPCYALLAAAGAEPFLGNRITRSITIAAFSCWVFAAYAAYFVMDAQHWIFYAYLWD